MTTKPTETKPSEKKPSVGAIVTNVHKPTTLTQADLLKMGFSLVVGEPPQRLVAVVGGKQKTGKTHFAMTAPEPIYYFQFDTGGEEGVEGFTGKKVYIYRMRVPPGSDQEKSMELWKKFMGIVLGVYGLKEGTVIIDTWDGAYVHAQMAYMGKLTQNNRPGYGVIYNDLNQIRDAAYDSLAMDTLLLNKYEKDFNTGVDTLSGWKDTGYIALVNLEAYRKSNGKGVEDTFGVRVVDCRRNMTINGEELEDESANWDLLKAMVLS